VKWSIRPTTSTDDSVGSANARVRQVASVSYENAVDNRACMRAPASGRMPRRLAICRRLSDNGWKCGDPPGFDPSGTIGIPRRPIFAAISAMVHSEPLSHVEHR
jgi:hypothetical protein